MKNKKSGFLSSMASGTIIALIATGIGILVFSLVVYFCRLKSGVIRPVNQFIKIVSIFLGCIFSIKEKGGAIKGAIVGATYSIIMLLVFALLGKSGENFLYVIADVVFCTVIGAVSGILSVNVGEKRGC